MSLEPRGFGWGASALALRGASMKAAAPGRTNRPDQPDAFSPADPVHCHKEIWPNGKFMIPFPMACPIAFRRQVLSIRGKEGLSFEETSERFGVGSAAAIRIRIHSSKALPAPENPQDPPRKAFPGRSRSPRRLPIRARCRVRAVPEVDLAGSAQARRDTQKASRHPQADAERRCAFRRKITAHETAGRPIVYLDESGFATDMPRPHGSAPRGTRCLGGQNRNARGREMTPGALLAGASLCVISVAALSFDPFPSGHISQPDHGGSHPGPAPGLPSRPPETPV